MRFTEFTVVQSIILNVQIFNNYNQSIFVCRPYMLLLFIQKIKFHLISNIRRCKLQLNTYNYNYNFTSKNKLKL